MVGERPDWPGLRGPEGGDAPAYGLRPRVGGRSAQGGHPAGLGLHFHDLRHTENQLTSQGATLRDVMSSMGHASTKAALLYQHADHERARAMVAGLYDAMEAVMAARKGHAEGTDHAGAGSASDDERGEP